MTLDVEDRSKLMEAPQTQSPPVSLCSPTPDLTCFGCCPPIRPENYDCLDYVGSLRREFMENRKLFLESGPVRRPIVGFHCWALGFLDPKGRRVGCLLHPSRNGGRDLRSLIDYGNKCGRESCVPAKMFDLLPPEGKRFWLPLARGLSPFHFSSPRSNPLFHLIPWGPEVLEPLRLLADKMGWSETELVHHHPFLMDPTWTPKAHRYLFRLVLAAVYHHGNSESPEHLDGSGGDLERHGSELLRRIVSLPCAQASPEDLPGRAFTHQLELDGDFLDFLRLGLRWRKASPDEALRVKKEAEHLALSLDPHGSPQTTAHGAKHQRV